MTRALETAGRGQEHRGIIVVQCRHNLMWRGDMPRRKSGFWGLVHLFYLGRAIARGPRYFLGYELRRQVRKATYRATRKLR